jgi:hypothetical protein
MNRTYNPETNEYTITGTQDEIRSWTIVGELISAHQHLKHLEYVVGRKNRKIKRMQERMKQVDDNQIVAFWDGFQAGKASGGF